MDARTGSLALLVPLLSALFVAPLGAQTGVTGSDPEGRPGSRATYVQVYADGAIRGAALGEENATAGTGSLGIRVSYGQTNLFARINVASTVDTITGGFGGVILSPANGGGFKSGVIDMQKRGGGLARLAGALFGDGAGVHSYLTAAASTWADETGSVDVVTIGGGMLLYKDIANGFVADEANRVRVKIEIGPSVRRLGGTLGTGHAKADRERFLGTTSAWFGGLEAGLQVEFGVVTGALQLYFYDDFRKDTTVQGVTGGQLVALFSIGGPIFSGELR